MRTVCCITQICSVCKPPTIRPKQNAPPFAWVACLRSILSILGTCAALCVAAVPATARHDTTSGMDRTRAPAAWQQFHHSRWPFDLPPADNREHDRGALRQPPVTQSGDVPGVASPPHGVTSCTIEIKSEPAQAAKEEPVQAVKEPVETTGAAAPNPAFPSVPEVAPKSAIPSARAASASVPMDWPSPTAGQTWLVVAAVFLFCAIFAPGAVVLRFLALAGFIISGTSLLIDLTWQSQVIVFALLGVALVVLWVRSDPKRDHAKDDADPQVNHRGPGTLVGRAFQLEKPIEGGKGMLTHDGTAWRVNGKDCAAGQRVRVIRAEGTFLIVDPLEC